MKTYHELEYPKVKLKFIDSLCLYLANHYLGVGDLLDIGCGKPAYHVEAFKALGVTAVGIDRPYDLGKNELPYKDASFDYVFSKSLLEHIHRPYHLLDEVKRILRPHGQVLFLVPDYTRFFWEDPTHIKPYTVRSLRETFEIAGFRVKECRIFYQFTWAWKYHLSWVCKLIALLPDSWQWKDKEQRIQRPLIRHSKQPVILLYATL